MIFSKSRTFEKSYKKLPHKIREQFKLRAQLFVQDEYHPILNNHKLTGEHANERSINVTGDYRAIFERRDQDVIYWIDIGTHAQLYE